MSVNYACSWRHLTVDNQSVETYHSAMILLEKEFVSGEAGFSANPRRYTQVKRNESAAIYAVSVANSGHLTGYEVFKIKVDPKGKQIFAKVVEDDTEKYPSTSDFGRSAWFVINMERANEYFDQITQKAIEVSEETVNDESPEVIRTDYKGPTFNFPTTEFSVNDLAEFNKAQYPQAYLFVKDALAKGSIKYVRDERRAAKGKPTKIYVKL